MGDQQGSYTQLSDFEKGVIVGMKHMKASGRDVASFIERDQRTVNRFYSHYVKTGDMQSKSGGTRVKKLSDKDIRRIKFLVRRDPFMTIRKIKEDMGLENVCERTVARTSEKYANIKSSRKSLLSVIRIKKSDYNGPNNIVTGLLINGEKWYGRTSLHLCLDIKVKKGYLDMQMNVT